jgi:hypothetical protein
MAISDKPWGQFSEADYQSAQAYCDASLINDNTVPRSDWTKAACKLPVYEPGGDLNRNGVHAAAARLAGAGGGVQAPPAAKRAAARKLIGLYQELHETAPDSIRSLAG